MSPGTPASSQPAMSSIWVPFQPTRVSVLMFVSVSEPAMKTQPSVPPARKYSLVSLEERGVRRQCSQVTRATSELRAKKTPSWMRVAVDMGRGAKGPTVRQGVAIAKAAATGQSGWRGSG